ncbi:MAG TPA: TonB-dependent receptor [Saprospiraceae bacterium]|nr:TonB-dependent receptor [Saprospiraceae bacterium]
MKMINLNRILMLVVLAMLVQVSTFAQGVTTSSMSGRITDTDGEALIGANVLAIHTPSGTSYGVASNVEGYYRIPNMRVGGPYTVTVSYTGYSEVTLEGVNLRLGEPFRRNFELEEGSVILEAMQVTAQRATMGTTSGASTQISTEDIENVPTLNRDLDDYIRLTPQASGFSFAGVNNRYNSIYVDGAVNNDVFGLASSGTNGGQTGIAPFSIDIIDQLQVVLSPYDVTYGGFAGGGVNAVTKSGTNEFKGTAYYFLQNENMVGKTNKSLTDRTGSDREGVDAFSDRLYGASLGGPIIKDKVFFFANAELRGQESPSPFDFGQYDGDASQQDLTNLRQFLINEYDYDPGTFGDVTDNLDGVSLFGKLDFNLNDNNRLTLRHSYTKAESLNRNAGNARNINFSNNGVFFPSVTNSSALELNSTFGENKFSNNLIIGYTSVRDDRDPIGGDFPYLLIADGNSTIRIGSEQFSTANALDQDIFTITDNFKIYNNDHTITIGTHNEFYSIYNLFIRQNYGVYEYDSIDDFLNDAGAAEYDRSYSLVDNITGDGSAAAASFNAMQLGLYVQDEWAITPQFTLTGGLRFDLPIITSDPAIHPTFNSETLPDLRAAYDVADNITGGQAPDGQLMISPRLGFTYDLDDNKSTLRGGLGIFTSRIPFVWPGAMFNNNGVSLGGVDAGDIDGPIRFIPNIQDQYVNEAFSVPSGQVDLFTEDFKYPQVLRGNLALDTELPGGFLATFEGVYTKTLNNVLYTNVNNDPTVDFNWTNTGADDRPVFVREDVDPRYSAIYVASNTNEGYTYTLTASLAKQFDFGLTANLSYTYGDAQAVNEGTSSQNSSQWRGQVHIDGRNNPVLGRSDFALGHRVLGTLNYTFDWNDEGNTKTSVTLLYEGLKGSPFSYVIGGRSARNINNETGSTSRNRSLIYIPASQNEITLVETNGLSPQEQWNRLNAFIEDDPYLSENRGGYAEKNSNFLPFTSFLDLSVRQDFGLNLGGKNHRMQLSWDVINLANLINPSWGVRYQVPGDFNNYELYSFEGYADDGTTPTFSYTEEGLNTDALNISNFGSRWRMRLGLRYIFN